MLAKRQEESSDREKVQIRFPRKLYGVLRKIARTDERSINGTVIVACQEFVASRKKGAG